MKFWKGPRNFNILLATACIIAGSIGIILELLFKDWTGVLISFILIGGGGFLYGFQAFAWKQWEEKKEKLVGK